jgi:glutaconate CoA-transferase subunit A
MNELRRASRLMTEDEALDLVEDGMTIAIGGFNTAAHPMMIVRGLVRRRVKDLRVVGSGISGLDLDLLIGTGVASEVVTASVTGEALASIGPFYREGGEKGTVKIWECDEGIFYAAIRAGGMGLPFFPWKAGVGTSIPELNPDLKVFEDPIDGQTLLAVPAIKPDIAFLHVARSDRHGLAQHTGSGFGDRALQRSADRTVVTVEKLVPNEQIRANPLATSIPYAHGVVKAPYGAHPFSSPGHYLVDEKHLVEYIDAAETARRGDRGAFEQYLDRYVYGPQSLTDYLELVGLRRLLELDEWE